MSNSSAIGKKHLLDVYDALTKYLNGQSIESFLEPVRETVKYILQLYPNIVEVKNKFETENPDQNPSLLLTLTTKELVKVNLFRVTGRATIQPKNLGVKSFLSKYFQLESLQNEFNYQFQNLYRKFLLSILSKKTKNIPLYIPMNELKEKVNNHYSKFNEEINPIRTSFLFEIRELCFQMLKEVYNSGNEGIEYAFCELMLLDSTNIITRYTNRNKCLCVEQWKSNIKPENLQLYKKGNNTIGIRSGEEALTIRFKFESSPTSSIKLATSYDIFPSENAILHKNRESVNRFEIALKKHRALVEKNSSNAVGKCNEAMIYYRFLKKQPNIIQVDEQESIEMLEKYSPSVLLKTLEEIKIASEITVKKIEEYLAEEFKTYEIQSMQLVPDNYLVDRLDTGDLQLTLNVNGKYVDKKLSLKAIAKSGGKVTTKNPGIGTILESQYFDVGSLVPLVGEIKLEFEQGKINHQQSMEKVSASLGENLISAPQQKLKKGLLAVLGSATAIITYYKENNSVILEHHKSIAEDIVVFPQTPTPIQTTLSWNDGRQKLTLRVKFSSGQQKGWSSLKLACEYKMDKIET